MNYTLYGGLGLAVLSFGMRLTAKKFRGNWLFDTLYNFETLFSSFLVGYILIFIVSNKDVNIGFVAFTVFIYVLLTHNSGKDIRKVWTTASFKLRLILLTLSLLVLLTNIEGFGSKQFGMIPRRVGGGKPEIAYVKFDKQYSDVPISLGIPSCTNSIISDQFCGPVQLLLRTDKELVFLISSEANTPTAFTNNIITSNFTNILFSIVTNSFVNYSTNGHTITVTTSTQIIHNVITNFFSINPHVILNPTRMTAKQVRADMVESVIFSR
jgi:hypothetical protein